MDGDESMKNLLPFGFLPGHWGLKGHIREEARILYEISDPEEQEIALAKLHLSGFELEKKLLDISKKYNKISNLEYEKKLIEISDLDETNKKIKLLDLKYKNNLLSKEVYEKERATLLKEPWVGIKESSFDHTKGLGGFEIELDWNEYFIKFLTDNNYKGLNDQQIVEEWFNDLCKSSILDEGLLEYYTSLSEENKFGKIKRRRLNDGNSEYS